MSVQPSYEEAEERFQEFNPPETEHKQMKKALIESEEKFSGFAKASGYGFAMGKLNGQLVFGNTAMLKIVEEKKVADFTAKTFYHYYSEENKKLLKTDILQRVMANGHWKGEISMLTAKGNLTPTEQNIFLIAGKNGKSQMVGNIITDITDRKRAEEELAQLNADLVAKNSELEQVVYVASHDLRSPLVNAEGYSKELGYAVDDLRHKLAEAAVAETIPEVAPLLEQDIPEALRFIRTSVSRMDTLLTGLLRLSRSGRGALHIESLDMNNLISKSIDSIEFQIKKAMVKLEVTDLPLCQGDDLQVNQVFSNLLDNAMKYLDPNRPGVIRISGWIEEDRAVYCIGDNGIGIASDHLDKIFEIFHRLDPTHSKGEGLGLTIVKRVLDRLGGNVWIESKIDSGSRFYVALPTGLTGSDA